MAGDILYYFAIDNKSHEKTRTSNVLVCLLILFNLTPCGSHLLVHWFLTKDICPKYTLKKAK